MRIHFLVAVCIVAAAMTAVLAAPPDNVDEAIAELQGIHAEFEESANEAVAATASDMTEAINASEVPVKSKPYFAAQQKGLLTSIKLAHAAAKKQVVAVYQSTVAAIKASGSDKPTAKALLNALKAERLATQNKLTLAKKLADVDAKGAIADAKQQHAEQNAGGIPSVPSLPQTPQVPATPPTIPQTSLPGLPPLPMGVRYPTFVSTTLQDVGYTVPNTPIGPVVYYNPLYMAKISDDTKIFFMEHEYTHCDRHSLYPPPPPQGTYLWFIWSQQIELDTDCHAAWNLASIHPPAVSAAFYFFYSQGNAQPALTHPTGFQRANAVTSGANGACPN